MTNLGLSATGKRVVVEARGEIFTIPAEKGDVRNITNSSGSAERQPAWSPDGKWISYFSDKSGEYKLVIESQDGIARAARDRVPEGRVLLHAGVVARFEEADVHRHQPQRVGDGHRQRPGQDRRQRSVDGAAAHAGADVEPRLEVGRVRVAPQHALSRDRRRQRRDRREEAGHRRPGRRDVPGVGRERQVPLVPRVHRLRPELAVARHDVVRPRRERSRCTSRC